MNESILIEGINPEPWEPSKSAIGRKNDKPFVNHYKTQQLSTYQEAIQEELENQNVYKWPEGLLLCVKFYFWRNLSKGTFSGKRIVSGHVADVTNLQKALEDACQGYLFENDRDVARIESTIISQDAETEPFIIIEIEDFVPDNQVPAYERMLKIPDRVRNRRKETTSNIVHKDVQF